MHKVGAARLERSSFWVTEPAKLPKKAGAEGGIAAQILLKPSKIHQKCNSCNNSVPTPRFEAVFFYYSNKEFNGNYRYYKCN